MSAFLPPRPVRRLVVDPLWVPVAAVLAVLLAVAAVFAAAVAPLTPRRRVLRLAMLGLTYLALDVGLLLGCLVLLVRRPTRRRDPARWADDHCRLLRRALDRLHDASRRWVGFDLQLDAGVEAVETPPAGPVIVLARHAGPGDSFALVRLVLRRYHRRPRVVLKAALQWDPGIDVILNRLSGCFLPSRTGSGDDVADRIADVAASMGPNDALLIFPEGGNWTPRRQRRVVSHLRRLGRRRAASRAEHMPRVLPPRPAGTLACLGARPDAHVVVVAHTGLDTLINPGQMWAAIPLCDRPMRLTWWCVPRAADESEVWLDAQWRRVDEWVAAQRAQDVVPSPRRSGS